MLFNGGNADLKLGEDEEGSFGIEISANPPGKKVQSLNSLSGGERTLTSLALLFAILSVNPRGFPFELTPKWVHRNNVIDINE